VFRLLICRLKKADIVIEAPSIEEIERVVEQDVAGLSEEDKDFRYYVARKVISSHILFEECPIVYSRLIHQGGDSKNWSDPKKF